jgi:cation diffusion facilitator CzcD-associated flavoprotein CzcO
MTEDHFDVLIVGAGLSGIGAAYRLQTECPAKSYAILEGRTSSGGTWDLFRFPGVRSDSDMFTLGYPFRPWEHDQAIAGGSTILDYIRATAIEFGIDGRIRYQHRVVRASWDSTRSRWTVGAEVGDSRESRSFTCSFLYMCSGYYSYEGGYRPNFPGEDRFPGPIVHPQQWPENLDYDGKQVVVIGSGATAVTLLPAMAERAGHVTMVQRSPTYILPLPSVDPIARALRRVGPMSMAGRAARWKNVVMALAFYQFCRRRPDRAKRMLSEAARRQLPDGYHLDPDFSPRYNPWDQRMCIVPDGDLFEAIKAGKASIATDDIDTFTEGGVRLQSGRHVDADLIVTATGLQLVPCGNVQLDIDGMPVEAGDRFMYRGFMLSDVPNLAVCIGYTNASWTLRADLTSRSVCRLINRMDREGHAQVVPRLSEPGTRPRPLLDLTSGYVQRAAAALPKQGDRPPWRLRQNYVLDFLSARFGDITESLEFPTPADAIGPSRDSASDILLEGLPRRGIRV